MRRLLTGILLALVVPAKPSSVAPSQFPPSVAGQPAAKPIPLGFDPGLLAEMTWRPIGPARGGRTTAVTGIASQPNVFFAGVASGGIWKTTDAGRTWRPIFDDQPAGSIGAVAVAPSNPNVIYAGTGEGLDQPDPATGDGLDKSIDGGQTWARLGLPDSRQVARIAIDPRDPLRLFVAVLGHPNGPNAERGVYRSTDGGRTLEKVLYKGEDTGAADVAVDPSNPSTIYAALWQARQSPWDSSVLSGPGSGLFKSTDAGSTWRPIGRGLPTFETDGLGRIGIAVAPSVPARIFAMVEASTRGGLYRSDDAGETFALVNAGTSSSSPDVAVHPANADIVFTASRTAWKSTDGGRTFAASRAVPAGEDFHRLWINPSNPDLVVMAGDRGAIVTVNGGGTWSSAYNQPTAAMSHVSTDAAFPYRVCGGQAGQGTICAASRSDQGQITTRDWTRVADGPSGRVVADPLDADILYTGSVTRVDRRTGQAQSVGPPRGQGFRVSGLAGSAPLLFAPTDPRTLFFGANSLWKTTTGGQSWTEISADLARETWEIPSNVAVYRGAEGNRPLRRGVISAIAPSTIDGRVIWAGTDDGQIHLTRDGGTTWRNVTPPQLVAWARVSTLEVSHFDTNAVYAAINTQGLDDQRPHIYRTKDNGQTWTEITRGLPDGAVVHAVREDMYRRGLLFAATDHTVHLSFDDGESWQSLRLNLPVTSVRDLVIKDSDVVIATAGRGFWILDDVTPLRQIMPDLVRAEAFLFRPPTAWRFRASKPASALLPQDEPNAPNPPDGVVLSYLVGATARGPVTLEIIETVTGDVIRRYSSDDQGRAAGAGSGGAAGPALRLSTTPGLHRFVWDVRYARPPIDAFVATGDSDPGGAPAPADGLFVLPGTYQVRLTVGGRALRQAVVVRIDPRVRTTVQDLATHFKLAKAVDDMIRRVATAATDLCTRLGSSSGEAVARQRTVLAALDGAGRALAASFATLQEADVKPATPVEAAANAAIAAGTAALDDAKSLGLSASDPFSS